MIHIEIVEDPRETLRDLTPEKMLADPRKRVHFMTIKTFNKTFTPERIRLLKYLKNHKVESISDLARRLGRKFEAVHRDIHYLVMFVRLTSNSRVSDSKSRIPKIIGEIEVKVV